jgi:hypothetical protein
VEVEEKAEVEDDEETEVEDDEKTEDEETEDEEDKDEGARVRELALRANELRFQEFFLTRALRCERGQKLDVAEPNDALSAASDALRAASDALRAARAKRAALAVRATQAMLRHACKTLAHLFSPDVHAYLKVLHPDSAMRRVGAGIAAYMSNVDNFTVVSLPDALHAVATGAVHDGPPTRAKKNKWKAVVRLGALKIGGPGAAAMVLAHPRNLRGDRGRESAHLASDTTQALARHFYASGLGVAQPVAAGVAPATTCVPALRGEWDIWRVDRDVFICVGFTPCGCPGHGGSVSVHFEFARVHKSQGTRKRKHEHVQVDSGPASAPAAAPAFSRGSGPRLASCSSP